MEAVEKERLGVNRAGWRPAFSVALPTGEHKEKEGMLLEQKTEEKEQEKEAGRAEYSDVEYAGYLEERLKQVLGRWREWEGWEVNHDRIR